MGIIFKLINIHNNFYTMNESFQEKILLSSTCYFINNVRYDIRLNYLCTSTNKLDFTDHIKVKIPMDILKIKR